MKNRKQQEPALRAVVMGLFPTMNTLDDVVALAESQLPITDPNKLRTLMFTYHNTLLKEIQREQETARPD